MTKLDKTALNKSSVRLRNICVAVLGWILAAALAISVVYGVYHAHISPLTTPLGKLNTALSRPAWTLALAWVTLASSAGYGGPVDWILSLPPLRPLSRLTYCAYLIHPLIIWFNYRNMEDALHGSIISMAWLYVGNLGISYAAALIMALVFEAPFLNLQKMLKL